MREFLEGIIRAFRENNKLPLRVVITSRVEEHIQEALDTPAARSVVHRSSLLEFDPSTDIRAVFQSRLSTLYYRSRRLMQDVTPPWPSESDLNTLVAMSDGSFLFATTLINLINSRDGLPQDNLRMVLTAEGGLDPLYLQILADAPRDNNFDRVIGTVMLLKEPIPIVILAHLLRLRPEDIVQTSQGLQSILMIPGDDNDAIQLFHASLRDFLISPARSHDFFINPQDRHLLIAADCLRVLAARPTDDFFYGDREMYACLNWCHHFEQGVTNGLGLGGDDLSILRTCLMDFASNAVDCWVNTSLLKGVKQLQVLRAAISKLKSAKQPPGPRGLGSTLSKFRVGLMWPLFWSFEFYLI